MFDAKKLLDALGTPAAPAQAAPTPPAAPAAPAPAATPAAPAPSNPLGAGTLLSDLIGLANQPSPPTPSAEAAETDQPAAPPPPPPKPKAPPPPADLSDLLINKAQEYLKTPQGNAMANAVVLGLTKAVANSETGRKLAETAKTKGTALFNRFLNKGAPSGPEAASASLAAPEQAALPAPAPAAAHDTALLVIRAMIAAAAADGHIDAEERERILGVLKQSGIDGEGVAIVEAELNRPATPVELAAAVKSPEMAVQVYTAVRRVITPNTVEERVFLVHLSASLGLDPRIVAQIDAMAAGAIKA